LPYFEPKLVSFATIQKTKTAASWSLTLPKIVDKDAKDVVTLSANFGGASFLSLNGTSSLECPDISKNIQAGFYLTKLTLDDGRDKVDYPLSIYVLDVPS
jgi:hypothetical protein